MANAFSIVVLILHFTALLSLWLFSAEATEKDSTNSGECCEDEQSCFRILASATEAREIDGSVDKGRAKELLQEDHELEDAEGEERQKVREQNSAFDMMKVLGGLARAGAADGTPGRTADGTPGGTADGATDGTSDGATVGSSDGTSGGASDGATDGASDGASDEAEDGASNRAADGTADGASEGDDAGLQKIAGMMSAMQNNLKFTGAAISALKGAFPQEAEDAASDEAKNGASD
eukprot:gnl/TRDRNA2_/TRDRNA2_152884_c0_seq1.p1 gnl/TRDRNA2_/TRDRNA2_152884_c0~~gnl/TRDRNA2_/TRDRNA2_152884_c0_seq1.p1  ORF type:complete len:236 (+),score=43.17 gnl/TRDRNA2_/TRDRNA2_152884_c0_seq1:71-778(+)